VLRRRRVLVASTLVAGTSLLAATLAVPAGSGWFTALGLLVPVVWIGGSVLSGPLQLGWRGGAPGAGREVAAPILLGGLAYGTFLVAFLVARELPLLDRALESVLVKADANSLALVLLVALANGLGEEIFYRGALRSALPGPVPARDATVVYILVTTVTLNVALVVAAAVMGTVFALERESTGGILAPILTHLTWSTLMLLALPR
jgi:uncharacterized protein